MLATSSQVTLSTPSALPVAADCFEIDGEQELNLLPQLIKAAEASKRTHLLVRRRKRTARRMAR